MGSIIEKNQRSTILLYLKQPSILAEIRLQIAVDVYHEHLETVWIIMGLILEISVKIS
jgi:hypothetical protein